MNTYPFLTKSEIRARIESNDAPFILECLLVMNGRQTEVEQSKKETIFRNRAGWMSSHAVNGTKLADKVASGETLTDEEIGRAAGMVVRYTKQLAAHFRQAQIAENPALAKIAETFSAA
jgi:hypothetical protein